MITNRELKKLVIKISDLEPEILKYTDTISEYYNGYLDGYCKAQETIIKLIPIK